MEEQCYIIEKELKHFDVIDRVPQHVLNSEQGLWIAQNRGDGSRFYVVTVSSPDNNSWCSTYDFVSGYIQSRVKSVFNFINEFPDDDYMYNIAVKYIEELYQASRIVTNYPASCEGSQMVKNAGGSRYDKDHFLHWWKDDFYMFGFLLEVLNFVCAAKAVLKHPTNDKAFPNFMARHAYLTRTIENYIRAESV